METTLNGTMTSCLCLWHLSQWVLQGEPLRHSYDWSEQVHEDNKRAQADFRAKWRRTIGMALHNTVAKQYLASLEAHTKEQEGLSYMG